MRSPDAPPTCPVPSLATVPGPGAAVVAASQVNAFTEGAVGPEIAQQRHADRNVLSTLLRARAGRGAYRATAADIPSPQQFVPHPKIAELIAATAISGDIAGAHLPGRVPPTVWDGEPSAAAPRLGG